MCLIFFKLSDTLFFSVSRYMRYVCYMRGFLTIGAYLIKCDCVVHLVIYI